MALAAAVLVASPVLGGEAAGARSEARSRASPATTLLRSVAFPGWGQLENGQPLKAVAVFSVEAGLVASGVIELRRADRSLEEEARAAALGDATRASESYQRYLDRRDRAISRFWWAGFALLLSMLDAYTDAHLRGFDRDGMPELPAEPSASPEAGADGGGDQAWGERPSSTPALVVDLDARRVGVALTF